MVYSPQTSILNVDRIEYYVRLKRTSTQGNVRIENQMLCLMLFVLRFTHIPSNGNWIFTNRHNDDDDDDDDGPKCRRLKHLKYTGLAEL